MELFVFIQSLCCVKTAVSQSELYGRVSLHHTSVSCPCFSARLPLMTQTPCDENNLCLLVFYILKTTWKLTCKQIFYTMEQFMQLLLSRFKENSRLFLQVFPQVPHFYLNTTHHDFKTFFLCIYGAVAVNNNHCVDVESFHTLHLLYLKNIYFKPGKTKSRNPIK